MKPNISVSQPQPPIPLTQGPLKQVTADALAAFLGQHREAGRERLGLFTHFTRAVLHAA